MFIKEIIFVLIILFFILFNKNETKWILTKIKKKTGVFFSSKYFLKTTLKNIKKNFFKAT